MAQPTDPDGAGAPRLPPAGEHGGDGPAVAAALGIDPSELLDLSQSLNPFAADPRPVVARHLDALGRYPDPTRATAALAEVLGVSSDRVLLTNGGAEAIALVASRLGTGRIDEPDFGLYRRHLRRVDPTGPRIRSNPHSPSGMLAAPDERAAVWDEAFYPLATGRWTRGDADGDSLVVGSLTKLFACPGLRLGYVVAPDRSHIDDLRSAQPAWPVNGLALGALPDLLAGADLAGWAAALVEARRALVEVVTRHGIAVDEGDANWILAHAAGLREALIPHHVLVRDCASFAMPGTVRIAVPDAAGLERLDTALAHSAFC